MLHKRTERQRWQKQTYILGVRVDNITMAEAIRAIDGFIVSGGPHQVVTVNADFIIQALKDNYFRFVLNSSALSVPDGQFVVWASRFFGTKLRERVAGSELVPKLCELAAQKGYRVFFLGSTKVVLSRTVDVMRKKYPELLIAGAHSPNHNELFETEKNAFLVARIRASKPDILFIALGAPKQDIWGYENLSVLNVPVCIGVGAAFDYLAGKLKKPSRYVTALGLEWAVRLVQQPRKIVPRVMRDTKFIYYVLRDSVQSKNVCVWLSSKNRVMMK